MAPPEPWQRVPSWEEASLLLDLGKVLVIWVYDRESFCAKSGKIRKGFFIPREGSAIHFLIGDENLSLFPSMLCLIAFGLW